MQISIKGYYGTISYKKSGLESITCFLSHFDFQKGYSGWYLSDCLEKLNLI